MKQSINIEKQNIEPAFVKENEVIEETDDDLTILHHRMIVLPKLST